MAQEADVALLVEEARMLLMVGCAVLHGVADVTVDDHHAVQGDADVVAIGHDLLGVPLADRLHRLLMLLA